MHEYVQEGKGDSRDRQTSEREKSWKDRPDDGQGVGMRGHSVENNIRRISIASGIQRVCRVGGER